MKKQNEVVEKIKEKGWVEIKSTCRKYRKFSHPKREVFCFVGKKGALRIGRTLANSRSLTDFILTKAEEFSENKNEGETK